MANEIQEKNKHLETAARKKRGEKFSKKKEICIKRLIKKSGK